MKKFILVLILLQSAFAFCQSTQKDFPVLKGLYLGQKPPGNKPELFAPGITSFGYHEHRMAISPEGNELYYTFFSTTPNQVVIMYTQLINGVWSVPTIAPFSDIGMNLHPAFSPDGKRIYFTSTRPLVKDGDRKNGADIWYVERKGSSWFEPINMGANINTVDNESSPTIMSDSTLFFESNKGKTNHIYISRMNKGKYQKAEILPAPINSGNSETGPFIAPDGSYLLFNSNRQGTFGEDDIFIAFRVDSGGWNEPLNLGEKINSKFLDWSPVVTPDEKYLIFSSYRNIDPIISDYKSYQESLIKEFGPPKTENGTFYWVSTGFIEKLKPKE